jgi:hypothetical protein
VGLHRPLSRSAGPAWIDPLPEQIDPRDGRAKVGAVAELAVAAVLGAALAVLLLVEWQR